MVTLRRQSGDYAAADRLAGALAAFMCLLVLLFHPHPFAVATMPVDVVIAFGLGLLASARSPAVRRALTPAARGPAWTDALASLRAAVARGDLDAFHAALVALGPPLERAFPRRADDRNELANTVEAS